MSDEQKIKKDIEELKEEFQEIRELAEDYAEDAAEDGRGCMRKMKKHIGRRSEELLDELMPIIEKYQGSGREVVERVENKVCDNPLLSLAVAFGAGLIIGRLLDNGRR
ncbi:hypothetical protein LJC40_01505 [Synergistaceae bacterium OttesenSCG-928-D05]|nr:hypothetical protein [Synergistaceae bacterium OttesenSCG-928-D05]